VLADRRRWPGRTAGLLLLVVPSANCIPCCFGGGCILERPVAEREYLKVERKLPWTGVSKRCSSVIVLEGELGVGGVLDCDDLGEVRPERVKELKRRPRGGIGIASVVALLLPWVLAVLMLSLDCSAEDSTCCRSSSSLVFVRDNLFRMKEPTLWPSPCFGGDVPSTDAVVAAFGRDAGSGLAIGVRTPDVGVLSTVPSWCSNECVCASLVGVSGSSGSLLVSLLSSSSRIGECGFSVCGSDKLDVRGSVAKSLESDCVVCSGCEKEAPLWFCCDASPSAPRCCSVLVKDMVGLAPWGCGMQSIRICDYPHRPCNQLWQCHSRLFDDLAKER